MLVSWRRLGSRLPASSARNRSGPLKPSFFAASSSESPAVSRAQTRICGFTFGIGLFCRILYGRREVYRDRWGSAAGLPTIPTTRRSSPGCGRDGNDWSPPGLIFHASTALGGTWAEPGVAPRRRQEIGIVSPFIRCPPLFGMRGEHGGQTVG